MDSFTQPKPYYYIIGFPELSDFHEFNEKSATFRTNFILVVCAVIFAESYGSFTLHGTGIGTRTGTGTGTGTRETMAFYITLSPVHTTQGQG